jgi:hypothetical protein
VTRRGKVELATARDLKAMARLHPAHDALSASALVLARALDEGAGLATAAVARQHAAIMTTLAEVSGDDNDAAIRDLVDRMSAPVADTPPR